jgi:DNA (cytosine-5)-methyltransferase 1
MEQVFNHQPRKVGETVQERINALGIGKKMQDLPEHLWHDSFRYYVKEDPNRRGGPNLRMIRLDPNKPSLTVTAYIFNKFVHPYENRFITPREAARLQGFPDDLKFEGTLTSTQRQVGNAVPIQLARAVFRSVIAHAKSLNPEMPTFHALSLFSGAGGLDIGASIANWNDARWKTFAAIDFDRDSCNTLAQYRGHETAVIHSDISQIQNPVEFCNQHGVSAKQVWLVFGGPPCQAFSQAGKQYGIKDPRGQLIGEYLRFIREISPRYFVMENVAGLAGIGQGALLKEILEQMDCLGYNVDYGLLNAADYGAPQLRKRLIFLGTRKDIGKAFLPYPSHSEQPNLLTLNQYMTVGEAFAGLPPCEIMESMITE